MHVHQFETPFISKETTNFNPRKTKTSPGDFQLNTGRLLVKINRFCAWMLLIFMIIFLISGYAWYNKILLPLQMAKDTAHRPGPVSGRLLPGARPDQHQIRSGALESGPRPAGERAAHCHRDSVLLVCPQHQIEACPPNFWLCG